MYAVDRCPVCGGGRLRLRYPVTVGPADPGWSAVFGEAFGRRSYDIVDCADCALLFRRQRFDSTELARMYGYPRSLRMPYEVYHRRSRRMARMLATHAGRPADALTVLDVGGGLGELSHYFAVRGGRCDVLEYGVEPRDLPAGMRFVDRVERGGAYDLVIVSHVLEHIVEPRPFMADLVDRVAADALWYVEVPFELVHYLLLRSRGHYEHVNYFSTAALRRLLAEVGLCGSTVERFVGVGGACLAIVARAGPVEPAETPREAWRNTWLETVSPSSLARVLWSKLFLH